MGRLARLARSPEHGQLRQWQRRRDSSISNWSRMPNRPTVCLPGLLNVFHLIKVIFPGCSPCGGFPL